MLELLDRCFPDRREQWAPKLLEMIPTMGTTLFDDPKLAQLTMAKTALCA
ncbi:hypothetical protein EEB13_30830 [Rhodococcus sp. WS3]|nr:putative malate:quinone oxidoreductase [Rhodococcus sp. AD45]ROZ42917.1 hypothetical protein EEB13_30830 [Rhodococcus sp. WS3]RZL20782.1 MAG: hypothetical protein EOP31_30870 [Rhodococcus sp. (in: high G+C Gram-positive bacteria)]